MSFADRVAANRAARAESATVAPDAYEQRSKAEMEQLRPYMDALEMVAQRFSQAPNYGVTFGAEPPAVKLTAAGQSGPHPEASLGPNGFSDTIMPRPTLAMVSGVDGGENEDRHFGAFIRASDKPGSVKVLVSFISDDMSTFPYERDYKTERHCHFEADSPQAMVNGLDRLVKDYAAEQAPTIRAGHPVEHVELATGGYGR